MLGAQILWMKSIKPEGDHKFTYILAKILRQTFIPLIPLQIIAEVSYAAAAAQIDMNTI